MIRRILSAIAATLFAAGPAAGNTLPAVGATLLAQDHSVAALNERCGSYLSAIAERRDFLASRSGPATIEGDLAPYDEIYGIMHAALGEFSLYAQVMPGDDEREAAATCRSRIAGVDSEISMSQPIYRRLAAIDASRADAPTKLLLTNIVAAFNRAGVALDDDARARIKALNEEIERIGGEFELNIDKAVPVMKATSEELAGLPEDYVANHPPGADGLIDISTDYPDQYPFMTYAESDAARARLDKLVGTRAYPQNDALLRQMLVKRQELAQALGRPSYAALILEDKMVNAPGKVEKLLGDARKAATPAGERDYLRLLAQLRETDPQAATVEQWQKSFLANRVKARDYDFDSMEARRYFAYDNVRDGMFRLTQDLFGVEIRRWETPVWHDDVEAFEMVENGAVIGRFYLDSHPREGKYSHDNAVPVSPGIVGGSPPLSALVMNLPKGGHDTGLMRPSDVAIFLHEYGHLLHMLFGGSQRWFLQSGISMEDDFVEAPSQMLENWVYDYDTLATFAVDENGAVIPRDLVEKMNRSRYFGIAFYDLFLMGLANISLQLHLPPVPEDLGAASRAWKDDYDLVKSPDWLQYQASFGHLPSYSAMVYTYVWSRAIADDLFTRFEKEGLRNRDTAADYRQYVLAPGGTKPAAELARDFLDRKTNFKAYRRNLERTVEGMPPQGGL